MIIYCDINRSFSLVKNMKYEFSDIIFYEVLPDNTKIIETYQKQADKKNLKLKQQFLCQLNNFLPIQELTFIVSEYCFAFIEPILSSGLRRLYVHIPKLNSLAYFEDIKSKFSFWWMELINQTEHEFVYDTKGNNNFDSYVPFHLATSSEQKGCCFGDDPFEGHKYEWPYIDENQQCILPNILRHIAFKIEYDNKKKGGVNFIQENKIKTIPRRRTLQDCGASLQKFILYNNLTCQLNLVRKKQLPLALTFKSREQIKTFLTTLSNAFLSPDEYQGQEILPTLYVRNLGKPLPGILYQEVELEYSGTKYVFDKDIIL